MDSKPIYKTAAELGIKQWEHDGLVALVGPLSRGEFAFDMNQSHCGTVGCIGGWISYLRNPDEDHNGYVKIYSSRSLDNLFFPGGKILGGARDEDHAGWKATAPQAARAIVNFLVTGDSQWDAVMATP